MGKIVTFTHVTLDGVMQAPGRPNEDTRGEFGFGGWEVRYGDEVMAGVAAQGMATGSALLFGRRTYEDFLRLLAQPHAIRAELFSRLGRDDGADEEFERAVRVAANEPERTLLERKREASRRL